MRYLKNLALVAVAAAALTASAAPASATIVTTTTGGGAATPKIHAVNEGGHVTLANSVASIECGGTVEGEVESHGSGVPVVGGAKGTLSFVNCTNAWTIETNAKGTLSVTWTSGHNGTVSSTGATVTAIRHTIFGTIECRYSTAATHIGTLTGGNPATLKIEGKIPFHSGGGLCGEGSSQWTGFLVTTSALYVAP